MTAPTVPPSRHEQIQQRIERMRACGAKLVLADVVLDDLQFLLNENRNIRHTLAELQGDLRGAA